MQKSDLNENILNVQNRTIFCRDNLEILTGINTETIDLVYLDPPFNKKKVFTSPISSAAEGASFSDIFREKDVKDEWAITIQEDNPALYGLLDFAKYAEGKRSYNYCYLCYISIRLIEIRRVLKDTGSVYLHCDPLMSHYLKLMMDCIFGEKCFRNEIIWCYSSPSNATKWFYRKHDIILFYAKNDNKFSANDVLIPHKRIDKKLKKFGHTGEYAQTTDMEILKQGKVPNDWWQDITEAYKLVTEYMSYPTQKPTALLERIIKASSDEGDVVLDPFCGCATTCVAAEKLNRQWIGVDVGEKTHKFVKDRLVKEASGRQADLAGDMKNGKLSADLYWDKKITFTTSPPKRNDNGYDPIEKKYVYIFSNPNFEGEYKVGIAKDWKLRLNSYQTSDPERSYEKEFYYLTPYYRQIEAAVHDKFENTHEWVRAELEEIKQFVEGYKPIPQEKAKEIF